MSVNKLKPIEEIYYDYWNYKGYSYSECHYNEKIKNIYINIPKNASTNIRFAIEHQGFVGVNLLKSKSFPEYESAVVVLRDPVDRWISGITTYLSLNHAGHFLVDDFLNYIKTHGKWLLEILFERVSFDDHTERQVYFLKPFDLSNAYYFYASVNDRLEYQLTQFYQGEGIKLNFEHDIKNYRKHDPIHRFFTEFLFDSKNRNYKEKLINYYKEDYDLINSVRFYGPR